MNTKKLYKAACRAFRARERLFREEEHCLYMQDEYGLAVVTQALSDIHDYLTTIPNPIRTAAWESITWDK